jgi:non-specific serine/threonine protein kinase
VAALIAQGLSNRQIAARLVITPATAGVHVVHILNKLGMHTRAQVAVWAAAHGLGPGQNTARIQRSHDVAPGPDRLD